MVLLVKNVETGAKQELNWLKIWPLVKIHNSYPVTLSSIFEYISGSICSNFRGQKHLILFKIPQKEFQIRSMLRSHCENYNQHYDDYSFS